MFPSNQAAFELALADQASAEAMIESYLHRIRSEQEQRRDFFVGSVEAPPRDRQISCPVVEAGSLPDDPYARVAMKRADNNTE